MHTVELGAKTSIPSDQSGATENRNGIVVYEWNAWNDFLFPAIFPESRRLRASIGQDYQEVLASLQPTDRHIVFHICLTNSSKIPGGRHQLIEHCRVRGISVLNGHVIDISKRWVQAACQHCGLPSTFADRDGRTDELLIVKTNSNYGGESELTLTVSERAFLQINKLNGEVSADAQSYKIYKRCELTEQVWSDENLVVERFVTNHNNIFFRVYVLYHAVVVEAAVSYPFVKRMCDGMPRSIFFFQNFRAVELYPSLDALRLPGLPADLISSVRRFCKHVSLEFGTIDMVMDDAGTVFIVDVNTTPFWDRTNADFIPDFLRTSSLP